MTPDETRTCILALIQDNLRIERELVAFSINSQDSPEATTAKMARRKALREQRDANNAELSRLNQEKESW